MNVQRILDAYTRRQDRIMRGIDKYIRQQLIIGEQLLNRQRKLCG